LEVFKIKNSSVLVELFTFSICKDVYMISLFPDLKQHKSHNVGSMS